MQVQVAPNPAIGTDRAGDLLVVRPPVAGGAQVELGLVLERVGGTHRHTVAAVHTRRVGQIHIELGADAGTKAAPGHGDGEGPLGILTTRLHTLVTKHAAVIGADVELVLHQHVIGHALGGRGVIPSRVGTVGLHPAHDVVRLAHVGRGRQKLEHHLATVSCPLGVGVDLHFGFRRARARGHQRPRTLHLHHTDPARIHRGQGGAVADCWSVNAGRAAGVEHGVSCNNRDVLAVHRQRHPRPNLHGLTATGWARFRGHGVSPMRPRSRADRMAPDAV